jgi:hypothetical protein
VRTASEAAGHATTQAHERLRKLGLAKRLARARCSGNSVQPVAKVRGGTSGGLEGLEVRRLGHRRLSHAQKKFPPGLTFDPKAQPGKLRAVE